LTLKMVKSLYNDLKIPADVLLNDKPVSYGK